MLKLFVFLLLIIVPPRCGVQPLLPGPAARRLRGGPAPPQLAAG